MVDQRVEDLYEFNIRGNFEEKLDTLSKELVGVQNRWAAMRGTFASTGTFAKSRKAINGMSGAVRRYQEALSSAVGQEQLLLRANGVLAGAYNKLAREQNKLAISRQANAIAIEQARRNAEPQIINARAEARAMARLSAALVELAADRKFAKLAADAGLQAMQDSQRELRAEATAANIAAREQDRLAVARKLASQGLDPQGRNLPVQGAETQREAQNRTNKQAQLEFARQLQRARVEDQVKGLKETSEEYKKLTAETKKAVAGAGLMTAAGKKTEGAFNRVSFTFRRLIGIMAAFTIARTVARQFVEMLTTAISFNSVIERTRVGISGLIAAAAEVRSPSGAALGLDDQLLVAQDLAIDQMKQLRREALETAASYEELATAFQTAIAPGLQSGLSLDQIREITVDISQAATGLGVAQNQLAEEIRSLFQGTITPKNTRVATALGISNADIRRAQELGTLFEFLQKRFAAISRTGVKLMDTFSAQVSNAADAFKQLLEQSSKPLFEQLKGAVVAFQKAIFSITDTELLFNPKALAAFDGLFQGLAKGVEGVVAAFKQLSPQGLADSFGAIGETLGLALTGAANALRLIFNIATPVLGIFNGIVGAINSIGTKLSALTGGAVGAFFTSLLRSLTILIVINGVIRRANRLWRLAVIQVRLYSRQMKVAATQTLAAQANMRGIVGLSRRLALLMRKILIPLLVIVALLAAADLIISAFGGDFSVFDKVSEGFGFLNDKLDSILVGADKLDTSLEEAVDPAGLGVLVNKFAELTSEVDSLNQELGRATQLKNNQLARQIAAIGAPSAVGQQLQVELAAEERNLELLEKVKRAILADQASIQKNSERLAALPAKQLKDFFDVRQLKRDLVELKKIQSELSENAAKIRLKNALNTEGGKKALRELNGINVQRANLELRIANITEGAVKASKEEYRLKAQQLVLADQIASNEKKIADIRKSAVESYLPQIKFLARQELFTRAFDAASSRIAQQQERIARARLSGTRDVDIGPLELETKQLQQQVEYKKLSAEISRGIILTEKRLRTAKSLDADAETVGFLEKQVILYRNIFEEANNLQQERLRTLEVERALAELRASNNFSGGINQGFVNFAAEAPTQAQVGEKFGQDLSNSITTFGATAFSEAIASAFDPDRNTDLAETASNLLFSLGNDLIKGLLDSLLGDFINSFKEKVVDQGVEAAKNAQTIQTETQAAGIKKLASATAGATLLQASASAAGLLKAGGAAAGAAILAAAGKAALILAGSSVAGGVGGAATGGAVSNMKLHSFAVGGTPIRPKGVDRRDTIPAYLRPGEWVIRPEAVQKYGNGLFAALNGMRLNPGALKGLSGGARSVQTVSAKPQRSFATGGPVAAGGSTGGQQVTVVQFYDEQVMDRALAAGRGAAVRFARTRRSEYRAALGLEPGS